MEFIYLARVCKKTVITDQGLEV